MANVNARDGTGVPIYLKATGAGSDVDPHVVEHNVKATIYHVSAQSVSFAGTSVQSAAFNSLTKRVILVATSDCWVAFGPSPTVVAGTQGAIFVPAGVYGYPLDVIYPLGKVAVIQSSGAGILNIIEAL